MVLVVTLNAGTNELRVRHHLLRPELSSSAASKRVSPLCSSSQVLFLALSSKLTFTK